MYVCMYVHIYIYIYLSLYIYISMTLPRAITPPSSYIKGDFDAIREGPSFGGRRLRGSDLWSPWHRHISIRYLPVSTEPISNAC